VYAQPKFGLFGGDVRLLQGLGKKKCRTAAESFFRNSQEIEPKKK